MQLLLFSAYNMLTFHENTLTLWHEVRSSFFRDVNGHHHSAVKQCLRKMYTNNVSS